MAWCQRWDIFAKCYLDPTDGKARPGLPAALLKHGGNIQDKPGTIFRAAIVGDTSSWKELANTLRVLALPKYLNLPLSIVDTQAKVIVQTAQRMTEHTPSPSVPPPRAQDLKKTGKEEEQPDTQVLPEVPASRELT